MSGCEIHPVSVEGCKIDPVEMYPELAEPPELGQVEGIELVMDGVNWAIDHPAEIYCVGKYAHNQAKASDRCPWPNDTDDTE